MQLLRSGLAICLLMLAHRSSAQQSKMVLPLPEGVVVSARPPSAKDQLKSTLQLDLIDLSGDSLVLGYLSTNPEANDRTAVVTAISKEEWLRGALGDDIQKVFSNRGVKGLFVINDISAGRLANGNYVRIKGAIYESPAGTESYRLVNAIDELFTDNAGDAKALTGTIAGSLRSSAAKISSGAVKSDMGKGLTRNEVIKQETEKYSFIGKAAFKTGIYMSYGEFKLQKPAFAQFFLDTDAASGKVVVNSFTQTDSTLRPCPGAWGIAVMNEVYVLQDGVLIPAEPVGNNLVLSKYLDANIRKNNGLFWRNNVGNRFSTHEAGNPFDNRYVIKLQNYRNKGVSGEALKLDADSGTPEL